MGKLIAYIVACIVSVFLETLVFWGVGSLITQVFSIDYNWTVWCGLVVCIFVRTLHYIFGGK